MSYHSHLNPALTHRNFTPRFVLLHSAQNTLESSLMKLSALIFCMAVTVAAHAQTAPKPATPAAKPATATKPQTATAASANKLPPGVPPVVGIKKILFS